MGGAARPRHDPGNHRSLERGSNPHAAPGGSLRRPAKPAGERLIDAALTPPPGARSQVVEDDDTKDLRSDSEVPLQLSEPQLEEPFAQPVWGKVKWYNPDKRYGFVELSDGSGDVFLHATALAGIGICALQPGETLQFRAAPGQRGPHVAEMISVDSSTTAPRPRRKSFRSPSDRYPSEASVREIGTVKWYNPTKGFGFIDMDGNGKEIFVHASALNRAGITGLSEGQRVFVAVAEGRKGPEAASLQIAY